MRGNLLKLLPAVLLSLLVTGCSLLRLHSSAPVEVVASCFSDGENQTTYCKSKRAGEPGRVITTRCIGTLNMQADPKVRGKCVEKECSENSNTDCTVKGTMAVLEQFAELASAHMFAADEAESAGKTSVVTAKDKLATIASKEKSKSRPKDKGKTKPAEVASHIEKPEKAEGAAEDPEESNMHLVLKPAKSRAPASMAEGEQGIKKLCVSKNEMAAPKNFRGKCAIRRCSRGKCSYQGLKGVFEWAEETEG